MLLVEVPQTSLLSTTNLKTITSRYYWFVHKLVWKLYQHHVTKVNSVSGLVTENMFRHTKRKQQKWLICLFAEAFELRKNSFYRGK